MNKKIFFALFLALILLCSISAIQANDINVTDSNIINSNEDMFIQIDEESQLNDLESVSSYDLSNNDYLAENNKNQTELTPSSNSIYYKGSYNVILKDSNTNSTLSNKKVNFIINNNEYSATTNSNGVASVNLDLKPGTYTSIVYFAGDDAYDASNNLTSPVKILPTISAKDITKYYKGTAQYSATFFDSQGNTLKNRKVTITVNGKSYSKKTNSKGVVSLPVDLKPGNYKIVSTDPITGYKLTTNFKILSTISSSEFKKVSGDSNRFRAQFFKSNGKALANKFIKVKVNGKLSKFKTNSNGKISLALNNLKPGTYKLTCYNNDGLTKSYNVKIYRISSTKLTTHTYTFIPGDNKEIKVRFSTSLGDDSKAGKIIKITINGVTYSKKTDSNGMVYLNVSSVGKGIHTVEYYYAGNQFFKSAYETNLLTILPTSETKLTVKSITNFGQGAGTPFKVAYTAGGVPLAKKTVTFTIGSKTYTDITDNNGIACLPIYLNVGRYTVYYKTQDDSKVNGTSGSCEINVFKRNDTKLTWESGTSYKDSSQSFKVLLTDSSGNPISGQTVELTIDSQTYYATTASNGYAKFTTYVPLGKYKVSVKFSGNNNFADSSTSKSINVELSKFRNGINEKNAASSSAYLRSSSNCPVGNAKIKSLVNSLTSGLTDNIDKAKAIFNYVRDNVVYSYYYDTKKGAIGALNSKSANCVDQAHLLISMYRTAGLQARYVHGTCLFSDGTFGHVWTQVLLGNTWVVGDPINYNNDLGKITNWNNNNVRINGKYSSLPF